MDVEIQKELRIFKELISDFTKGKLNASSFEKLYWNYPKSNGYFFGKKYFDESTKNSDISEISKILNELLLDVEAFCPDPELIEKENGDLDEKDLLERAKKALNELKKYEHLLG